MKPLSVKRTFLAERPNKKIKQGIGETLKTHGTDATMLKDTVVWKRDEPRSTAEKDLAVAYHVYFFFFRY